MEAGPQARWARWERQYGVDPETRLRILRDRWEHAGGDDEQQQAIIGRAVLWALEEIRECARIGRTSLGACPAGAMPSRSTEGLIGLFHWHVDECLRRAVAMLEHAQDEMTLELGIAVGVVSELACQVATRRSGDPIDLVERGVADLARAEVVLAGAHRAECRPLACETFSGVPIEPPAPPEPPAPSMAPSEDRDEPATLADRMRDLAETCRRRGATVRARLLEHMAETDTATFQDLAHEVHGDDLTSDTAIRKNVCRVNEDLAGANPPLPVRLRVASSTVFRDIAPE